MRSDDPRARAEELLRTKVPYDSLRRLVHRAFCQGSLSPWDVICEHEDRPFFGEPGAYLPSCVANHVHTPSESSKMASSWVGLDTIKVRSAYLFSLLNSPRTGNLQRNGDRGCVVQIEKYSPKTLGAYVKYLHEDALPNDPTTAIELLELAREYGEEQGLAEQWTCAAGFGSCEVSPLLEKCLRRSPGRRYGCQ